MAGFPAGERELLAMRNTWLTERTRFAIGLVFLLGGLNCGLNAAPAGNTPPTPPPPVATSDVIPLTGKIAHIIILGTKNIPADAIRAVLTSKVGNSYQPEAADKDLAAIHDMGAFQKTVSASATAVPGGVDLTYTVAENPIIKSIRFTANTPTKEPTIPAATLIALMKTRVGQVLNTKVLVSDLDALFNHDTGYVSKQGYIFDVSADINIDPPTGVLAIPLVEAHVQSIQITGNSRVKTADILAQMHSKPGDLYDGDALNKDISSIYEMGGFKEVQNYTGRSDGPNQISITIPVVEHEAAEGILDETRGKIFPFLYDPVTVPFPVIQVSVNGQPPLPFVVDTGTTTALSLDFWAATRLGLKTPSLTEKGDGFNFVTVPIRGTVLQGADRASDAVFDTSQAQILDLSFLSQAIVGKRVAGIIGLGMFLPVTTRFDFAAKALTVFAYPHPPLRPAGATVRPLRLNSERMYTVHVTLTPGQEADLILDTGSVGTQIPLADVGVLHPTATAYGMGLAQIDSLYLCPDLRLSALTFGTLQVPDVVVGTLPSRKLSLGMNILAGYRLTLDGPNSQLALEPSARGGRYVRGWSGLDLKRAGAEWSVRAISGVSPALKAGVRVGDELLTVNGQRIGGLSRLQVKTLTSGLSERPLRISLRRGQGKTTRGKDVDVSWTPLDEFSAPRDALDGLSLKKPNGSPWIILSILPGCPGDRAGLQVGDEITRMNGAPVAKMPLDRLVIIMGEASKSITLTVQRAGRATPFSVKLIAPP